MQSKIFLTINKVIASLEEWWAFEAVTESLLRLSKSKSECLVPIPTPRLAIQMPVKINLGRQHMMAQEFRSFSIMWKTQTEF